MTIVKNCFLSILIIFITSTYIYATDYRYEQDSRIRTYEYNPNAIYPIVLHYGFQSHLEFANGEEPQTISLGESYAWKITRIANRLFIKPLEKNIRTNMTIITNKRTYQFDLIGKEMSRAEEKNLVYVIRFNYPKYTYEYKQ